MCLNKPRLLMSQNIKNIDKHQFRGNFADFFGTSIAELKKTRIVLHNTLNYYTFASAFARMYFHNKFSLG